MRARILLIGVVAAIFAWGAVGASTAFAQGAITIVEVEWLKENLNNPDIRIVDVSNRPNTYQQGHIPGAVQVKRHIDLADTTMTPTNRYPTQQQFEQLMGRLGITPQTTVVAYDDTFSLFASRLLVIMEMYGHDTSKLKLLNGGSPRWQDVGNRMTTNSVAPPATDYQVAQVHLNRYVSWNEINRDVVLGGNPEVMLLDSRPANEFSAKRIRAIRGGNIPGSINVTGSDAMMADQRFRPLDEMKAMYEQAGFTADKVIYEYCHSGDRSAHAYIILTHLLGYENVRFNDGGWLEWASLTFLTANNEVWKWEAGS